VFDYASLTTASEVYQAARILNFVKWADTETDANQKSHIKGRLESAKTSFVNAYNAVNSLLGQVDSAIAKLSGGTPDQTLQTLQRDLVSVRADISKKKGELGELEEETKRIKRKQMAAVAEKLNKQKYLGKYQKALHILRKQIPTSDLAFHADASFQTANPNN